ncbi:DNA-binding transcriptional repressor RpiR [Sebaldella termitidis]|uniref:Transcriptional regulator, RpiR family n=1 Tax=Sebaldella termitidis (strain ATCC 33386 / NCTC 11300) TaxID=526218 RepID=D1AGI8_SEBTE|nr:MurR/RpiR family transcriptional regulator [Sebaldella termitidis]ACZ10940.1 transcriptional regulator, RpiR family [Sebaldella termitidis ATCC 33386]MBP7979322.1 MurR/RpiR family transcriptional regulator [Sebaldella sp.]SUI26284.1 DNA-binding transcriptional repressor RpiR [Sebaldella termitidis]
MNIERTFKGIKLTSNDKIILDYITKNIDTCLEEGVRGVAKNSFSSTSSIMRLSKKLGYSGFVELIYDLKKKMTAKKSEKINISFFDKITFNTRNKSEIDQFLKRIHRGKIMTYGEGFSEIASSYMYRKLLTLGKIVYLLHGIDFDILCEKSAMKFDLLLIVSKSGETKHCIKLAKQAKEENITVCSFTGNAASHLAKLSDISFTYNDPHTLDDDVYYPNPFIGLCIIGFEELIRRYFEKYGID